MFKQKTLSQFAQELRMSKKYHKKCVIYYKTILSSYLLNHFVYTSVCSCTVKPCKKTRFIFHYSRFMTKLYQNEIAFKKLTIGKLVLFLNTFGGIKVSNDV